MLRKMDIYRVVGTHRMIQCKLKSEGYKYFGNNTEIKGIIQGRVVLAY